MLNLLHFLALTTSVSAGIVKYAAVQVYSDFQQLNTDVNRATSAANNFDGTLGTFAPVQTSINAVLRDLQSTDQDALATTSIGDGDADSINGYITSTLQPSTRDLINALVTRRQSLTDAGLKPIFAKNGNYLRGNATLVRTDYSAKVSSGKQNAAYNAVNVLVAEFNCLQVAFA